MYPLQETRASTSYRKKFIVGLLIIVATLGTSLASILTINTNNRLTFGQGIFHVRACDGWIDISFDKTSTSDGVMDGGTRVQAVSAINLDGFNANACKNTNFKIKLYKSTAPTTPLALYQQSDSTSSSQVWLSVSNAGLVTLLDTAGRNLGEYGDDAVGLAMDADTGRYTIYFFTPLQPAANIDSYTLESGPNRA